MAKRGRKSKIDWENIKIVEVPVDKPNSGNPYSEWTPGEHQERLSEIYAKIYSRMVSKKEE